MDVSKFDITPVEEVEGVYYKRDDRAFYSGPEYPSGLKVRQYITMADQQPGAPMLVGCSADSAMQIYVAAAAKIKKVQGVVYTAARKVKSAATQYAYSMGATVHEIRPAYLSCVRARARDYGRTVEGGVVRWNFMFALKDAAHQAQNIPTDAKRVVVPTGSGLVASGILAGMAEKGLNIPVVAVATSTMAKADNILANAQKITDKPLPAFELVRHAYPYKKPVVAFLPGGDVLDPFYAAKAFEYLQEGDCFWIPGVRPVTAMPKVVQDAVASQ